MTNIGLPFRQFLRFSKLRKFTAGFNNYSTTSMLKKDIHGKDLYPWKYGTSYYEAQDYSKNITNTDEDSRIKKPEKERRILAFEQTQKESWTDRED